MSEPTKFRVRGIAPNRTILMMENTLVNVGDGPVEFRGRMLSEYEMTARQIVERSGGRSRVALRTGARLQLHVRRQRPRLLLEVRARGTVRAVAARRQRPPSRTRPDRSQAQLLQPRPRARRRPTRARRVRPSTPACPQNEHLQTATIGTSVGWVDRYPWTYPNNWIEVTGQKGCFVIIHRADPNDTVREKREDNNTSSKVVRLPFRHGVQTCPRFDPTTPPTATGEPLPPEPEPVEPKPTATRRRADDVLHACRAGAGRWLGAVPKL